MGTHVVIILFFRFTAEIRLFVVTVYETIQEVIDA